MLRFCVVLLVLLTNIRHCHNGYERTLGARRYLAIRLLSFALDSLGTAQTAAAQQQQQQQKQQQGTAARAALASLSRIRPWIAFEEFLAYALFSPLYLSGPVVAFSRFTAYLQSLEEVPRRQQQQPNQKEAAAGAAGGAAGAGAVSRLLRRVPVPARREDARAAAAVLLNAMAWTLAVEVRAAFVCFALLTFILPLC